MNDVLSNENRINMLQNDVGALATPRGRMVGTSGHAEALSYITNRLIELGVKPYSNDSFIQPYSQYGQSFYNIIAKINGKNDQLDPILIGAHYDTCGQHPGADDNAAAIAIMFQIIDRLNQIELNRSIVFAFFDGEEPPNFLTPSMGSIRFYEDQKQNNFYCAIVMDLVGHDVPIPTLEQLLFITGMESNEALATVIKDYDPQTELKTVPTLNSYIGDLSDHHIFRINQIPYLLLTCGRWEHYHMASDLPDNLNYVKMQSIADYLINIALNISNIELSKQFGDYDSSETELYFLNEHLKPMLIDMGINKQLNSRNDIDQLVGLIKSQFSI